MTKAMRVGDGDLVRVPDALGRPCHVSDGDDTGRSVPQRRDAQGMLRRAAIRDHVDVVADVACGAAARAASAPSPDLLSAAMSTCSTLRGPSTLVA